MNILFYTGSSHYSHKPVGGAEVSMQLMAEKMAQLKENVFFATLCVPGMRHGRKKEINGVHVYSLGPLGFVDKIVLLSKSRSLSMDVFRRQCLAQIIKREKIDLVYAYDVRDLYDILKAREVHKLNIKIVKRFAGLLWAHMLDDESFTKEHVEKIFNSVDAVNYLTPIFKELVVQTTQQYNIKFTPKKEIVMDIGINLDLFRYQWSPPKNPVFKIVSVARFSFYQKRQDLLIESLNKLKIKNFIVDFIGTGDILEKHKALCHQLGMRDHVVFHDYIRQERIIQILSAADLFVLPSDYEGLPKSLLEAMAVGTPCLVSDVMPLNSYIQDGVNGFLVGNTPEQWAHKIDFISQERDRLMDVSRQGRKFVVQNFNADENILKYQEEFKKIIASSSS